MGLSSWYSKILRFAQNDGWWFGGIFWVGVMIYTLGSALGGRVLLY
jgi:hypothetical protein